MPNCEIVKLVSHPGNLSSSLELVFVGLFKLFIMTRSLKCVI